MGPGHPDKLTNLACFIAHDVLYQSNGFRCVSFSPIRRLFTSAYPILFKRDTTVSMSPMAPSTFTLMLSCPLTCPKARTIHTGVLYTSLYTTSSFLVLLRTVSTSLDLFGDLPATATVVDDLVVLCALRIMPLALLGHQNFWSAMGWLSLIADSTTK